jgi:hypothetical protein
VREHRLRHPDVRGAQLDSNFALARVGRGLFGLQATREPTGLIDGCRQRSSLVSIQAGAGSHLLGIIYHGTGKIERAVEEFERALGLTTSGGPTNGLGAAVSARGLSSVRKLLPAGHRASPGLLGNYALGSCYYDFGRYRDTCRSVSPRDPGPARQRPRLQQPQGDALLLGSYGRCRDVPASVRFTPMNSYANLGGLFLSWTVRSYHRIQKLQSS